MLFPNIFSYLRFRISGRSHFTFQSFLKIPCFFIRALSKMTDWKTTTPRVRSALSSIERITNKAATMKKSLVASLTPLTRARFGSMLGVF